MTRLVNLCPLLLAGLALAGPENLAPKAAVSASSEFSGQYLARFAVDGVVPDAEGQDDANRAWASNGARSAGRGWFALTWPAPVEVGELVYFARTGWILTDTWRGYAVYLDQDATPAAQGELAAEHGPQRVRLPRRTVSKLRIEFLSAHSGPNPGASEIAVYASSPSDQDLEAFMAPPSPLNEVVRSGALGFRDILVIKRHRMDLSHVYTYHAEGFQPGGGLYVWSPGPNGGSLRELVASPEGEILDCSLSYDAKEVVFSWKRRGQPLRCGLWETTEEHPRGISDENYQIYRINLDGTGLTQLTSGQNHNLNACWLPDGGIAFISDRQPAYAYCFVTTSPVLYRMEGDGSRQRRLSSNYLMDFTPAVLNDGRIIYTRWEYVDRPAIPIQSLWVMHPDGTGVSGFYGNRVLDPGTFMQPHPMPGSDRVICTLTGHNGSARGAIGLIDPAQGANAQAAITNLTPEIALGRVDAGDGNRLANAGPYESPFPVDANHFLVCRNGEVQLRTIDGGVPPASLIRRREGMGFYGPIPVATRPSPPVIASNLPAAPADAMATVVITDVYAGLAPEVKRGEIKQFAVVEEIAKSTYTPLLTAVPGAHGYAANTAFGFQFPLVSCGATYAPKRIWGYVDVPPDGAVSLRVPAEKPIHFQVLDAQGRVLQRMRTFVHFMPGEVQGCVGCHADRRGGAPQSRLANLSAKAAPQELRPPEWGVGGFSYRDVVQPVLDKYCVTCHNERSAPSGVDLSGDMTDFFNVSYDILARRGTIGEWQPGLHGVAVASGQEGRSPYTSWISTINGAEYNILMVKPKTWGSPKSRLADIVLAGHPDAQGQPRFQMDTASQRRVLAWIDLNVPYYPNSRVSYADTMGCRRLFPADLDKVLAEVAQRRCQSCHGKGIPRTFYIRVEKPELNNFALAPLARAAGGTEACGKPIFATTADPDYQAILGSFAPIRRLMHDQPRDDML
ncbi:MAG: hypothetical protein HZB16_19255 [Armatimonadetes bacterium]|nr:hypothetical protein [Armatimonadota bacterium]